MFIVVAALSLLALLGAFGLSAVRDEIRASGSMRDAMQVQKVAEQALIVTAELLNPTLASAIVAQMFDPEQRAKRPCTTVAAYAGTVSGPIKPHEACFQLTEAMLRASASSSMPALFADDTFGQRPRTPVLTVELSNPTELASAEGFSDDPTMARFIQLTATVLVNVRATSDGGASGTVGSEAVIAGRGRLTVGPVQGRIATYQSTP